MSFAALFRYATTGQIVLLFTALVLGVLHGAMMPIFSIIFGQITKDFTPTSTPEEIRNTAAKTAGIMASLGIGSYLFAGFGVAFWNYIGESISCKVKLLYFQKILNQEIGWFDVESPEKLTTNYNQEMSSFRRGVGQAVHMLFFSTSMTVTGLLVGLIYGWLYSVLILITIPFMFFGMGLFVAAITKTAEVT